MEEIKKIKIKQPPVLFARTQSLIQKVEENLDGLLITYWNNPKGQVCHNDVVAFFELLERIGKQNKIYVFIKSDGGHGQASLRIVNLLRKYCKEIVALVPLECASAATMMAIGANEIRMGPMAYLTAVDTSLTHDLSPIDRDNDRVSVSLDELSRVIKLWQKEKSVHADNPYKSLFEYVHPLVIGAVDRAESLSIMICKDLLSSHIEDECRADEIAQVLNSKYPSHSYPILYEEAKKIGLNVKAIDREINSLLLQLNKLYSEMGQRATTDFDDTRAHSNEITNILEANGLQIYFQQDKDWFYRSEERRWISLNDNSSWRKTERHNGKIVKSIYHIA
ncbi:MAG: ATP-dependent Clp protease proteolytic subunit [Bacteroidota bacterium]|nr:ATP-dependent Clp protease proteolytic subunit [Bacteroidota bacterium]MDP4191982.1 ATP-dependent Clp protease proteolytic subunit [Bacteroidota bacterium]MDP4196086.1 ATP-dependent Clp protease proteolytic subunit [Bacteroidota bacterium]